MEHKALPLHAHLASLPVYQPGRPLEEVARELGIPFDRVTKLASNENPLGPSPKAVMAMQKAAESAHLYPDGNAYYLKEKLAALHQLEPSQIILSNGSNELIEWIGHVLLDNRSNIVVSQYCFAIYPIVAAMFGAQSKIVPATDFGHDLEGMLQAVDASTKAVFVANPNNPTGTLVNAAALRTFVSQIPSHVLVVLDEAYVEYLEDAADFVEVVRSGAISNLLLMRTFSKIYGLAGCRLGYGMASASLVAAMEKVRQPFNANSMAQSGALAALDDQEHLERSRQVNREGLTQLQEGFLAMGLSFVPSSANFVLVKVGQGKEVFQAMQRQGIIVRPMDGYQLPSWVRVSVGTQAQNQRFLEKLSGVLEGSAQRC